MMSRAPHTRLFTAVESLQAGAGTRRRQGDDYRLTSLHIAACEGHEGIASILLRNEADVDVLDAVRNSPMIWAKRGHLAFVETLLAHAADVSVEAGKHDSLASSVLGFTSTPTPMTSRCPSSAAKQSLVLGWT